MQITSHIVDTPPRDAATVLMLREGSTGLEVLLLKRHTDSKDLGGAFVFRVVSGMNPMPVLVLWQALTWH